MEYEKERMGNDDDDDDDVLEDLQPHSNLKELKIRRYPRLTIPSWAREDGLATSLPNLVKIVLVECNGLKELPWLGKLQHLKTLELYHMENLECMENKTWSTNIGNRNDRSASSSMAVEVFFPSLKYLELVDLPKLKGWWIGSSGSGMRAGEIAGGQRLPLFPSLSQVTIEGCPNLRSIPLGPAMEILLLTDSRIQVGGGTSSNDFGNSGTDGPKIKEIVTDDVRFLNSLPMDAFQGLTKVMIYKDDKVECLPEVKEVFRGCSSSLRFLTVVRCDNLRGVSRGLEHLAALESLELVNLPELRFDETQREGEGEEEDDNTGNGMPWRCLAQCLRFLKLLRLPKVVELPKGMCYLTALQFLDIQRLPLKDLPEWVGCLRSLHSLRIIKCKNLESLPEALRKLTSLKRLKLESCTKILHERCKEPNGEYWPIIQHINDIENLVSDSDSE